MLTIRQKHKLFLKNWDWSRKYFLAWTVKAANSFADYLEENFEVEETEEREEIRKICEETDWNFLPLKWVVPTISIGSSPKNFSGGASYFQVGASTIYWPEIYSLDDNVDKNINLFVSDWRFYGIFTTIWVGLEMPLIEESVYLLRVMQSQIKKVEIKLAGVDSNAGIVVVGDSLGVQYEGTIFDFNGRMISGGRGEIITL